MKTLGYYNGKVGELDTLTVPFCDRVHFFGDGVYAVLTHTRDGKIIRGINNRKYNQFIVDNILAMEETDENVYVYGEFTKHPIYVVIDIVDNNVKMYAEVEEGDTLCMTQLYNMIQAGDAVYLNDYEDFSESERKIFVLAFMER